MCSQYAASNKSSLKFSQTLQKLFMGTLISPLDTAWHFLGVVSAPLGYPWMLIAGVNTGVRLAEIKIKGLQSKVRWRVLKGMVVPPFPFCRS